MIKLNKKPVRVSNDLFILKTRHYIIIHIKLITFDLLRLFPFTLTHTHLHTQSNSFI